MFVIVPVWLVGFLWSIESAFFVTAVLVPFVLHNLFSNSKNLLLNLKYLSLIPISLFIVILFISLFYIFQIGNLPDFYSFVDFATHRIDQKPFYLRDTEITITGATIVLTPLLILSWMITQLRYKKNNYIVFSIWMGIWAISSYIVAHSFINGVVVKLLVFYIFGFFFISKNFG